MLQYSNVAPIREHIPEGITVIFEAPQRFGKTMSMVVWNWSYHNQGRTIFSNIQLGFPHEPLEFTEVRLEDETSKYWNGHIGIDELNFYYDCRRSMSKGNLEFGAFLLQQKKQGCNLTGTTHNLQSLDVRLRENFDFLVNSRVYPAFPEVPQLLRMHITNGPLQRPFSRTLTIDCRPFLGLYDTFAVYDPFKKRGQEDEPERPKRRVTL